MSDLNGTSTESTPTNVSSSAKINTSIGKSTTADDLLEMYNEESSSEAKSVDKQAETSAKVQELQPKKQAAQEIVKKLEEKEAETPTEEPAEKLADGTEVVAKLRAKLGEEDVEIPESASFEVEINGKPVKFSVVDAVEAKLQQETFNREMDRRVNTVSQKERMVEQRALQTESRLTSVLTRANEIAEMARSGDVNAAVKGLARLAANGGKFSEVEYERQFFENLNKAVEIYSQWSPEQKDAYFAERRAEAAEKTTQKLQQERQWQEGMSQIDQDVNRVCENVGIPKEQFLDLYSLMAERLVGPDKKFKSLDEITPKAVGEAHVFLSARHKVLQAVTDFEGLTEDSELVQDIIDQVIKNPGWSTSDVKSIVNEIFQIPSESVQNLNRKLETAKSNGFNSNRGQGSTGKKESSEDKELDEFFHRRAHREGRSLNRR